MTRLPESWKPIRFSTNKQILYDFKSFPYAITVPVVLYSNFLEVNGVLTALKVREFSTVAAPGAYKSGNGAA